MYGANGMCVMPVQSDTIPLQSRDSGSRTPSVMHGKRGGCQTRKASNILLPGGGWPSFAPPRPDHRAATTPPAAATGRLHVSHGITGICEAVWRNGNALCRAGKLFGGAKRNEISVLNTMAFRFYVRSSCQVGSDARRKREFAGT
jgi:hypothetical protein